MAATEEKDVTVFFERRHFSAQQFHEKDGVCKDSSFEVCSNDHENFASLVAKFCT